MRHLPGGRIERGASADARLLALLPPGVRQGATHAWQPAAAAAGRANHPHAPAVRPVPPRYFHHAVSRRTAFPRCAPALRIADAGRLRTICAPMRELREQCLEVCRERARIDGSIEHLEDFDRSQANDSIVRKMACYRCSDCAKPFCGGKIECEAEAGDSDAAGEREDTATQALSGPVCDKCAWKPTPQGGKCEEHGPSKGGKCEEHGPSKAIFKCDCCCDVATFDCGGNHYCDECHKNPNDYKTMRAFCRGRPQDGCPLRVTHPPNQPRNMMTRKCGFVVGCVSCLGIDEHCQMGAVSQQTRARWRKAASVFRDES